MEALNRVVSESFARHGFERPLDFRRLKWSRWFRCDSHHSLLFVPSKPGVFAIAEEITSGHVGTAAPGCPPSESSAAPDRQGRDLSRAVRVSYQGTASAVPFDSQSMAAALAAAEAAGQKPRAPRMLAVTKFFEADDMAYVLDRMLSRYNPMRGRLASGRYFVRFVTIEDESQRHSIYTALNQWIASSSEKATGIAGHFASFLELAPTTEETAPPDDSQGTLFTSAEMGRVIFSAHLASQNVGTASPCCPPSESSAAPPDDRSEPAPKTQPCPFPSGF